MFIEELHKYDIKQLSEERKPAFRQNNVIWPSELSANIDKTFTVGECGRSLFYKILGHDYSNGKPLRVASMANAGKMYEAEIVNKFKNAGYEVSEQQRVSFKFPNTSVEEIHLSGKTDVIIRENNVGKNIEIKTIYGFKAVKVFGEGKSTALPTASNLMQALSYKYYYNLNPELNIDKVYLMYINRGDGAIIYFDVDIDEEGYPIIQEISVDGVLGRKIYLKNCLSFEDLANRDEIASSDESRLAEIRINIKDIFKKTDNIYSYAREGCLPPRDYMPVYDRQRIELEYKIGRISKIKYNASKKGTPLGDSRCSYCNYKDKCLSDSKII